MIRLLMVTGLVAVAIAGHVVELTSDSFESLTQISTGATTGDWLIKFYAPWCGPCKKIAQEWENLAQNQHDARTRGDIGAPVANIANVNCDDHPDVCKRFAIKDFPTFLFFQQGLMYEYMGARTVADFERFIDGGYKDATGILIPNPPSISNTIQDGLKALSLHLRDSFTNRSLAFFILVLVVVNIVIFRSCFKFRRHSIHDKKVD